MYGNEFYTKKEIEKQKARKVVICFIIDVNFSFYCTSWQVVAQFLKGPKIIKRKITKECEIMLSTKKFSPNYFQSTLSYINYICIHIYIFMLKRNEK